MRQCWKSIEHQLRVDIMSGSESETVQRNCEIQIERFEIRKWHGKLGDRRLAYDSYSHGLSRSGFFRTGLSIFTGMSESCEFQVQLFRVLSLSVVRVQLIIEITCSRQLQLHSVFIFKRSKIFDLKLRVAVI